MHALENDMQATEFVKAMYKKRTTIVVFFRARELKSDLNGSEVAA